MAVLFERARPELEQVCHGDLAPTAPISDARELNETLRTPGHKEEEVVVLVEHDPLDRRRVLQSKPLTDTIDQPVEVALDVLTVVRGQNAIEMPRQVVVDARRDEVCMITLGDDTAELVGQCEVSSIFRVKVRSNEDSSLQGQVLHVIFWPPLSLWTAIYACTAGLAGRWTRSEGPECIAGKGCRPRIMSAAFSAIMNTAADVLAEGTAGIIEASAIRRLSKPRTRN